LKSLGLNLSTGKKWVGTDVNKDFDPPIETDIFGRRSPRC